MPAVALTDHGSLAGSVDLYKAARDQGIKPIVGCEVYVADDRHARTRGYAHLTLLAESNAGYSNLIKLSSLGYLEGYYTKPRVDWELLERYSGGLIALSGCLSGRVCKALEESRPEDAAADLDRLATVFGRDNTYVELQNAGLDVQQRVNPELVKLAAEAKLPLVATGDVHYLTAEDAYSHEALLCIQSGDSLKNPNHWKFDTNEFYFKTPAEMALDFPGHEDAMRRTLEVAERCSIEIELGNILLPKFPTPNGRDAFEYLVELCDQGLERRYDKVTPGAARAAPVRAEDDPRDGLRRLLPDRLGLHPLREGERDRRRPRPRLGRRLARRLRARDHRHRPDQVRPALRALPQPGPQVDARHRHRLRRRGPRAGDQLRLREVRPRPRRPDHHLRDDGRPRRRPRRRPRARDPLRRRRPDREADPGRPGADARRVPQARLRPEDGVRDRSGREGDHRPGAAARGARPPGLDPRRRRRHRRRAADRHDPAAAEGRRPGGRDPVLDEHGRGARPAEDGLPRPAQPRRDRQGGRADRRRRHDDDPARRQEDVRDARARRGDGRLPVRVVGHARGAAAGEADRLRGPDRARRALPAGADAVHPELRQAEGGPGAGRVHRPAPEGDHRLDLRDLDLPGAVDGDREADRRLQPGRGGRPAQGDRQEDPQADGVAEGQVHRRLRRQRDVGAGGEAALGRHREVAGLLVQQVARGLLRADRLPDGVAEGEPPVRVHGGADLLGDEHEGPGAAVRQRLRRARDRGAAARRQHLADRLRGRRGEDPLRPERGQVGRASRPRARSSAPATRAARSSRSGTSPSASTRRS